MMGRVTAWAVHAAVAVLFASGSLLLWLVFFRSEPAESLDPDELFAAQQHPWQATISNVHLLLGPVLVFLVGLIWGAHVWTRISGGAMERRRSGIALAVLFPLLAGSGYALQITADEDARVILGWAHAGIGVLFGLTYGLHQLTPRPSE